LPILIIPFQGFNLRAPYNTWRCHVLFLFALSGKRVNLTTADKQWYAVGIPIILTQSTPRFHKAH
jgi:hypothetical protein